MSAATTQNRARSALRTSAPYIKHLAEVIGMAVDGADPRDGIEFVRRLGLLCNNTVQAAKRTRDRAAVRELRRAAPRGGARPWKKRGAVGRRY